MAGEIIKSLLVYGLAFAGGCWFLLQIASAQDARKAGGYLGERGEAAARKSSAQVSEIAPHKAGF